MAIWGRLCLAWCCVLVTLYYYISESLHLHGIRGKEPKNMFGLRGKSAEKSSSGSALLRKTAAGMMPRDHHILHKKCKSDRLSTAMLSEELAEDNVGINGAVLESYRDFLEEGDAPDTQFFEYVANHCDLPRSTPVVVDTDTNETATIADVKVTGMKIFVKETGGKQYPKYWTGFNFEKFKQLKTKDERKAFRKAAQDAWEALTDKEREDQKKDADEKRDAARTAARDKARKARVQQDIDDGFRLPQQEWDDMDPDAQKEWTKSHPRPKVAFLPKTRQEWAKICKPKFKTNTGVVEQLRHIHNTLMQTLNAISNHKDHLFELDNVTRKLKF